MASPIDFKRFIGNKYFSLKVISESDRIFTKGGNSKRRLKCLCDCGNIKDYDWQSVIKGKVKSCGCYSRKMAANRMKSASYVHGGYGTPEYNVWQSMKKRCLVKTHKHYNSYGGRGITICDEWINSFENFLNDIGKRPDKSYSLDRIDNNKGYFKENCRWATKKQQAQNQRYNVNIEYEGKLLCVAEWARILNMSYAKLHYRLFKANYSIEKAFTK